MAPTLFTYPYILILLTINLLFSTFSDFVSIIPLSVTYLHVPDEAQMNMHQSFVLVKYSLKFFFISFQNKKKFESLENTNKIKKMF